jgi:hypothetical protein
MTTCEQKGFGLGDGESLDHGPPAAAGLHRVALTVVFSSEVINNAGEKDPKHIKQYLGYIDVASDVSDSLHGDFSFNDD